MVQCPDVPKQYRTMAAVARIKKTASPGGETVFLYLFDHLIMPINIVPAIGISTSSIMRGFCANLIIESISSMFFFTSFPYLSWPVEPFG